MNKEEFQREMDRLVLRFTDKHYPREVCEMVWNESHELSHFWFKRTVTNFIGSCRFAPLLNEFREAIHTERERVWRSEKSRSHFQETPCSENKFGTQDIREIIGLASKRMSGAISKAEFQSHLRLIYSAAQVSDKRKCKICDKGVVIAINKSFPEKSPRYAFKCSCELGLARDESWPIWGRQFEYELIPEEEFQNFEFQNQSRKESDPNSVA